MNPRLTHFAAGPNGDWRIRDIRPIHGETLPLASHLSMSPQLPTIPEAAWVLRGVTSNERYVTRGEKDELVARQEGLGRPHARLAALIPIKKNDAWWTLTQEERRRIFEEHSHHTRIGMAYLPAIARRLHHCRDLDTAEPFDFLTWFEFPASDEDAFDQLLAELRRTPEWKFVSREVEIRLERTD